MEAPWRRAGLASGLILLLALLPGFAQAPRLLPLTVHDGECECVLPTGRTDDKWLLLVGSLSTAPGPYSVTIHTEPATGPASLPLETTRPDARWRERNEALRRELDKARREQSPASTYAAGSPPPRRAFWLFVREQGFRDVENYACVTGQLRATGKHCQVYVDRDFPSPEALQPTIDEVVRVFDEEVYPEAGRRLGQALDVDRDGRFTVLFTPWLGKLCNGKVRLGGFVRGSDFYRDQPPPFSNRCDMLYLNTDLEPGPHLRTLIAHEYTHAVVFSEHVFGNYLPAETPRDEEGWLNEALAHLSEDRHGYSWSNLDYRVSAFLSAPERYRLVVPDYYASGLWRSHGNRGATYLFLRWCADQQGDAFAGRLVRSSLSGTANVEAATGEPFAELFRKWTAAVALTGSGIPCEGVPPLHHLDLRQPLADRLLCGPRVHELALSGAECEVEVAGTAAAYVLLHTPPGNRARVVVSADRETRLQVSLVRLPSPTARLTLHCEPGGTPRQVRVRLTISDADVTLDAAAWEVLVPAESRVEDTSYRAGRSAPEWLPAQVLHAGETWRSDPITLPERSGPLVFKVAGTDAGGHRVAAWAMVPATVPGH